MDNKTNVGEPEIKFSWLWRATTYILVLAQIPAFWTFLIQPMLKGEFFAFTENGRTGISDFVHFYAAGIMAQSVDRLAVYDPSIQLKWLNQLIAPHHCDDVFYIQYVPFIFPAMVPLAKLSMLAAYWMWVLVSLTAGITALYVILHNLRKINSRYIPFIILLIISSIPSYITLYLGQTAWLMLAFFCLYFWNWHNKRDIAGGICLALSSIKPQYALFLAMPAVASRRWRMLAIAALIETAFLIAAGFTIGFRNVLNYPHILWQGETNASFWGVNAAKMICVRAPLSLILPATSALNFSTILMIFACLATLVIWIFALKRGSRANSWAMALTVVLCLTFSAHCHVYDSLLLAFAACLTLGLESDTKSVPPKNQPLAQLSLVSFYLWSVLLILYPLMSIIFYSPTIFSHWQGLPFLAINFMLLASGLSCFFIESSLPTKP